MQLHLFSKAVPVVLAGLIFAGCASGPARLTGNEPLTVKDFIKGDDDLKLKVVKRVAIPNFFVQFVRDEGIEIKASRHKDMLTYFTQTREVSDAVLQKVADQLYDDFVGELKTAGIEVMPIDEMDTNPDFQAIRKEGRKSPFIEEANGRGLGKEQLMGVSILTSAKGLPINIMNTFDKKWLSPGVSDSFKGATLGRASYNLAKAWKVPVLNVRMTVSMITQKGTSYTTSWKFKTDLYPRFVEGGTLITVFDDSDKRFVLTRPVVIKDLEITGTEGGGAGARGSGLFGALGRAVGGSKDMKADCYIDVNPDNFTARVNGRGKEVARLFIEAMSK